MKKILGMFVLIVLLLFAGSKVLIWYQVTAALNELKRTINEVAIIDWGWIASSYDGQISIDDVEITPFKLKDTIYFENITLSFSSGFDLLLSSMKGNGLVLPVDYQISFESGTLSLSNNTLTPLQPDDERYRPLNLLSLYGCGDITRVTGRELLAMGFDNLNLSMSFAYSSSDGMARMQGQFKEMLEFDVDAKILAGNLSIEKGVITGIAPLIKNMQIKLKDAGYFRRLSFLCGRLNGLSQSEYIATATDEWLNNLGQQGVFVGPEVRKGFTAFADDGAEITVNLAPTSAAMKLFASLFDDDAPRLSAETVINNFSSLGLHLSLNNGEIIPVDLTFDKSLLTLYVMDSVQLRNYLEAQAAEASKVRPVIVERGYKVVSFANVEELFEEKIRVEVLNGRIYEGVLSHIGKHGIEITTYIEGGSVAYLVANEEVFKVEVWR